MHVRYFPGANSGAFRWRVDVYRKQNKSQKLTYRQMRRISKKTRKLVMAQRVTDLRRR